MPRDKRKESWNPEVKDARPEPQMALFDAGKSWQNEWKDMPEFIQHDLRSMKQIIVHFETREDLDSFAELLDQRINMDTKSIWYPEVEVGRFERMRWVDAEPTSSPVAKDPLTLRCLITSNPCGTDTWEIDNPCQCENCQTWLASR